MTMTCPECGLTSAHAIHAVVALPPEALVPLPCGHAIHAQDLHNALAAMNTLLPPPDVNAPFACKVCGCTRFIELVTFNDTNCRMQSDPVTNPVTICCNGCKRVYRQTEDWTWSDAEYRYMVR